MTRLFAELSAHCISPKFASSKYSLHSPGTGKHRTYNDNFPNHAPCMTDYRSALTGLKMGTILIDGSVSSKPKQVSRYWSQSD